MAGWIEMPLGTEVDVGSGDIVLDENPTRPQRWEAQHPQFWSTCCGQMATWIKVPLRTGVGLTQSLTSSYFEAKVT